MQDRRRVARDGGELERVRCMVEEAFFEDADRPAFSERFVHGVETVTSFHRRAALWRQARLARQRPPDAAGARAHKFDIPEYADGQLQPYGEVGPLKRGATQADAKQTRLQLLLAERVFFLNRFLLA
jgi:hypothetical protein